MDHPGSLSPTLAPWRAAALVAGAVAAVELFLLVAVGLALAAKPLAKEAEEVVRARAPAASPTGQPGERAAPALPRGETSVLVLNGNGLPGAAGVAAERVRGKGYLIAGTANATRADFPRSIVMFRAGFRGEAARLARDLGVKRVAPLDGLRRADLQGAHVALVVGHA